MKKFLIGAIASLALTGAASAATFTTALQTINFGTHVTEFDPNNPNQSYATQSFQLFDSTLGTLIGITVQATYAENTNLTVKNTGSSPATGTINTTSTLYIDAADSNQDAVFQNIIPGLAAVGSTTCFGTRGCTTAALGANSQFSTTSNSGNVSTAQITDGTAADLAYFQSAGGGLAQVLATTQSLTNLSTTNSNVNFTQATTGTPTFTIFYTYQSSVPEPATWAMMIGGFGLVGFGLRRRGGVAVSFN